MRLILIQPFRHFGPRVQFEDFPNGDSRFYDGVHFLQGGSIYLVDGFHRQREVVVVVTDIYHIGKRLFTRRRHYRRSLCRWIITIVILRRIMEDGITSLGHQFLAFGMVPIIFPHRISDNPEGEVVFIGIERSVNPQRVGHVRIAYVIAVDIFTLSIPSPPSVEATFADRQLDLLVVLVLIGCCIGRVIIIEDTFVLVHLLHTFGVQWVAGSSFAMLKSLVGGVVKITNLRNGETEVYIPVFCAIVGNIGDIDICCSRRTDTVLFTADGDGVALPVRYLAPRGRITILVHYTDLRLSRVVEVHSVGKIGSSGNNR